MILDIPIANGHIGIYSKFLFSGKTLGRVILKKKLSEIKFYEKSSVISKWFVEFSYVGDHFVLVIL